MFHTYRPIPQPDSVDESELKREDLVMAIETAGAHGLHRTEEALVELLGVLDEILGDGGQITCRVKTKTTIQ